ncbi:UDP-N-acetylmuramoyl-tripeptide--D-alanyl-D-alanine ligase [Acetobacter sp. AN02]|uniref:UDP-N-acetylmuramoyl-tripeptide--D-alanyl-D- alanine ligase n=1 Tax=Acetobacter sp. AN02 TaxID=2894186 RepID=UPI0024343542|nr:UDP-N-acetylmuramoyl-tripeptide--D-alanyl-D-alanine ligase [Acetobacter sp. AN02]MDG6094211.1 UDP-N-acetylmuramoyl-tripeptide--D-alanyl-D-alanine ligase [Acetobacter sp. AN02]
MSVLWTRDELETATEGRFTGPGDIAVSGISIDTRTLSPGDLFIALRGDASDGHRHIAIALEKGAAAVMSHDALASSDPRILLVQDTMAGLQALGRAARARFSGHLIAITGSVGKTTTKEMLRTACSALGRTHAAVASYNNHWGVPLTLARMPRDAQWCISEIGMNHPGEIAPLAAMCRPHTAVITTIGSAHLGHMGSIEAIAEEKAAVIDALLPGGTAIVPDDAVGQTLFSQAAARAGATLWKAGEQPDSTALLTGFAQTGDGSAFTARIAGRDYPVRLPAPGRHLARNALAALAAIIASGGDGTKAAPALDDFLPGAGRGSRRSIMNGVTLLDESYNASVPAIRAALDVLGVIPAQRRIVVLGDMRELGDFADAEHLSLREPVEAVADKVFCCGRHMKLLFDALPPALRGAWSPASGDLAPAVRAALHPGDAVLVKGSLGSRMKDIIAALETTEAPA